MKRALIVAAALASPARGGFHEQRVRDAATAAGFGRACGIFDSG